MTDPELVTLLGHADHRERDRARQLLAERGDAAAGALIDGLRHERVLVRATCAGLLDRVRDARRTGAAANARGYLMIFARTMAWTRVTVPRGLVLAALSVAPMGGLCACGATDAAGTAGGGGTGATGSGGTGGSGACTGSAAFEISLAPGADPNGFCEVSCSGYTMGFTSANGTALDPSSNCGIADCGTCEASGCPNIFCPNVPFKSPQSAVWKGLYYVGSTCGAGVSCQASRCAPPGHYTARVCVSRGQASGTTCDVSGGAAPACAQAQFDFPSSTTTSIVIGP